MKVNLPDNLTERDIYSFLMFVLFKMQEDKNYSTLSELAYILDSHTLLMLCEYFGGLTITIPTIDELQNLIMALLVYKRVDVDGVKMEKVLTDELDTNTATQSRILRVYENIRELIKGYDFK